MFRLSLALAVAILAAGIPASTTNPPRDFDAGERFDAAAEAHAHWLRRRLPPGATELPIEQLLAARERMESMPHVSSLANLRFASGATAPDAVDLSASWTALGPGNVGGRTMAIAIDPSNTMNLYAGAAGGGVWKSTDRGATWAPASDTMANLSVASLAIDQNNPQIVYAGTGEGDGAIDKIQGAGVFKSVNGGGAWTRLASTTTSNWYYVNDIRISALSSQVLVAATGSGLWTSPDGGTTFNRTQVASSCFYVVSSVTGGVESWLASCGNFSSATVYRSTDATTWTPVISGEAGMGRTSLAIRGTRAYALAASYVNGPDRTGDGAGDYNAQLHAFFRSSDSGATWTPVIRNDDPVWGRTLILSGYYSCATFLGAYGQGWYDNAIAIDPLNPDSVWVGGILLYRSDDGGATWGRGPNIHPDHHVLVFDPGFNGTTNQMLYDGEDGGIYRLDNSRAATGVLPNAPGTCTSSAISAPTLNHSYAATQFYHGSVYPGGTRYMGGAQDNSVRRGTDASGPDAWSFIACGDGGYTAIDPIDNNTVYASCNGLSILKSTTDGVGFAPASSGIPANEPTVFIPPLALDPNNSQNLWFGGTHAYRTTNATASWSGASAAFAHGTVSAIAIAPGNSNRVLMATSAGRVNRSDTALSDTAATAWTEYTVNAGGYLSSIAFAPGDAGTVYATISTFGRPHVLKSIDGGANWTNITGNLPDVPALAVVVDVGDPSRLFVGTDVGVFTSTDGGATWAVEITGFPNVSTEWLAMTGDASGRKLFAFTHGRGAFRADLGTGPTLLLFKDGFE